MHAPTHRHLRRLLAALSVGILAVVAGVLWEWHGVTRALRAPAHAAPATATAQYRAASGAASPEATAAFPWHRATASSDAPKLGVWELCGYGRFDMDSAVDQARMLAIKPRLEAEMRAAENRIMERLQSGDAAARFTALLAQSAQEKSGDRKADFSLTDQGLSRQQGFARQMMTLAQSTDLSAAWYVAHSMCQAHELPKAECAAVAPSRWVERHPQERRAWLQLAAERQKSGDTEGAQLALERAAEPGMQMLDIQAIASSSYTLAGDGTNGSLIQLQQAQLSGASQVWSGDWLIDVCGRRAPPAPERRAACIAVGNVLHAQATNSSDLVHASAISKLMNQAVGEQAARRAQVDALVAWNMKKFAQAFAHMGMSCKDQATYQQQQQQLAAFSEVGAMRRDLARTGMSVYDMGKDERTRREAREQQQAAQARAAPVPAARP